MMPAPRTAMIRTDMGNRVVPVGEAAPGSGVSARATHQAPRRRKRQRRERALDEVARHERQQSGGKQPAGGNETREHHDAAREDHQAAEQHGGEHGGEAPVPPTPGEQPGHGGRKRKREQVARAGTRERSGAESSAGEYREAEPPLAEQE